MTLVRSPLQSSNTPHCVIDMQSGTMHVQQSTRILLCHMQARHKTRKRPAGSQHSAPPEVCCNTLACQ